VTDLLGRQYLDDALARFREAKSLGDRAMAQVSDEDFFLVLDAEANSIALIVKHMTGNMRSRWTDFLTSDGEKPDRQRDTEFETAGDDTRDALMARWEREWTLVLETVGALEPDDLLRTVLIRAEAHTVVGAINRQLTHYAYHTGQIVFLAKHFASAEWKSLSVARGRTAAYNAEKMGQ